MTALLLAAALLTDDRPPLSDRNRLPSQSECLAQWDAALEWEHCLETRALISPSRAHLLEADLATARSLACWWHLAYVVAGPPAVDADRTRMFQMRAAIGADAWALGAWPLVTR